MQGRGKGGKDWSWLWTPNAELSKSYTDGLGLAIKWVVLPVLGVSLLVMMTGEVGLILGGLFAAMAVLMLVFLVPGYLVSRVLAERQGADFSRRKPGFRARPVGGDVFLHPDGRLRDLDGYEIPRGDPRLRKVAYRWRVYRGVYVDEAGRITDRNGMELSPEDPRLKKFEKVGAAADQGGPLDRSKATYLGGGFYLHSDGSYRDDRYRCLSPDAPPFKMLAPGGPGGMSDAALKAHYGWINRVHVGGGNLFAHGDGRFSDRNWNEIPADDPRVQEYNVKRGEEGS